MNELSVPIDKKLVALEKAGATREAGARVIAEAMVADKMTIDKYGEEHTEPDHTIRLRAEELRARYTGDIKSDGAISNNTVVINVGAEAVKELLGMVEDVRAQMASLRTDGRQTGEIIDV